MSGTPWHQVYLSGYVRRRRFMGLPRGAPFVLFIESFTDAREADKYARILNETTGYCACVLWGNPPLHKAGEPFFHPWFFN